MSRSGALNQQIKDCWMAIHHTCRTYCTLYVSVRLCQSYKISWPCTIRRCGSTSSWSNIRFHNNDSWISPWVFNNDLLLSLTLHETKWKLHLLLYIFIHKLNLMLSTLAVNSNCWPCTIYMEMKPKFHLVCTIFSLANMDYYKAVVHV